MNRKERAQRLAQDLPRIYPNAHCELNYQTPFQLLVATILSAQCTDVRVNQVTQKLFAQCPDLPSIRKLDQAALEKIIHPTGFYRNKAKNIKKMAEVLAEKFQNEIPRSLNELASLPGVGRKTANVVLGNAFGLNEGIVVDTHVTRLANRLGLTKHQDAVKIEKDLIPLFPRKTWTDLSHWLIWHGRRRCGARKPDCQGCEIQHYCPSANKVSKVSNSKLKKPAKSATK